MYVPPEFVASDSDDVRRIVEANPLATVVGAGGGKIVATHVPVVPTYEDGRLVALACHVARANTHWKAIAGDVLVIFRGVESYITPGWYPSKVETGKVVPTWNYEAVHVNGTARAIDDTAWLARHVADVTDRFEAPQSAPWATSDAPERYMEVMLRGIVGVEIAVTSIDAKIKASQNKTEDDRRGVIEGLSERADPSARAMAALVARDLKR
ncbi:MAG: FMN-binding negative transcriptional regulator [Pseudomonadota bacterium]